MVEWKYKIVTAREKNSHRTATTVPPTPRSYASLAAWWAPVCRYLAVVAVVQNLKIWALPIRLVQRFGKTTCFASIRRTDSSYSIRSSRSGVLFRQFPCWYLTTDRSKRNKFKEGEMQHLTFVKLSQLSTDVHFLIMVAFGESHRPQWYFVFCLTT